MDMVGADVAFDGRLVVLGRRAESEGVVSLELGLATGEDLPEWTPGAHIELALPNGIVRQYSLCGRIDNRKSWRIAVLREPDGRGGSSYVHGSVHEGTEVLVRGPRNNFRLENAPGYVFLAGGTGITPLLPMIAEAHATGAEWVLHYGGRRRAAMAFLDELDNYGDRVRTYADDEGARPDLDEILGRADPSTAVYCCGPSALIQAVESRCPDGWPGALHVERFAASSTDRDEGQSFDVVLRTSGVTLTVPGNRSILAAVEEAGISVYKSCEEGVCGSCETAVVEGEVDHRDSVLTEEERAAMDTMMICVSRAACDRLVLGL